MKIKYYGKCEKNQRDINMDSLYMKSKIIEDEEVIISIVCDGVGSLQQGALASTAAVMFYKEWFENINSLKQIGLKFLNMAQEINLNIKNNINIEKINSATTLTACLVLKEVTYCVHVGDSSLFKLKDGEILKITTDNVSDNNTLFSYIGQHQPLSLQYNEIQNDYDYIMLCSDGITKTLSNVEIKNIIYKNKKVENMATVLVNEAIKNNETDNITCAVIKGE